MSESVVAQDGSRVIVSQTDQGVRISMPLRFSTRAWLIAELLAVMSFVLIILPSSLRTGAQTLGRGGVIIFLVLTGFALLLGVAGIILFLLIPSKGAVIDLTANELMAEFSWRTTRWPREKIRSITMRRLPIGLAVVTTQIGYDQPVLIGLGPKADAQRAARELRVAMNLAESPNEGVMWIPGWD